MLALFGKSKSPKRAGPATALPPIKYAPLDGVHRAAARGLLEEMRELALGGADLEATMLGHTPLRFAASMGHRQCASELAVRQKVDVNAADRAGVTALHLAVGEGYYDIVCDLLGASARQYPDGNKWWPLHDAAEIGRRDIADALISAGASLSAKNNAGHTPEVVAANAGHTSLAERLIECRTGKAKLALDPPWAGAVEERRANEARIERAFRSIEGRDAAAVMAAVSAGEVAPNAREAGRNWALLHSAAAMGLADLLVWLVDHGADPRALSGEGMSAAHLARVTHHRECEAIMRELERKGTSV